LTSLFFFFNLFDKHTSRFIAIAVHFVAVVFAIISPVTDGSSLDASAVGATVMLDGTEICDKIKEKKKILEER
jgi:hypothetical protein